jgi:hypothetical protein
MVCLCGTVLSPIIHSRILNGGGIMMRKTKELREETIPVPLCPTGPATTTALGVNLGLHGEKLVTNCLYCGMDLIVYLLLMMLYQLYRLLVLNDVVE